MDSGTQLIQKRIDAIARKCDCAYKIIKFHSKKFAEVIQVIRGTGLIKY